MPRRTYVPAILIACRWLVKVITNAKQKIIDFWGEGLYELLLVLVDACQAVAQYIEANSDAAGNYDPPT